MGNLGRHEDTFSTQLLSVPIAVRKLLRSYWTMFAGFKSPTRYFLIPYFSKSEKLFNYVSTDNVKALFRRGKAHLNAWNPKEAKSDFEVGVSFWYSVCNKILRKLSYLFQKAAVIDPSLSKAVQQQLNQLEEMIKEKNKSDKAWLSQAFGKTTSS